MAGRRPDPSLPRHGAAANPTALRFGYFVQQGDVVFFKDLSNNTWPRERVQILRAFGFTDDGLSLPVQPTVMDPVTGKVLVEGDVCAFHLLNGNEKMPVVIGAVAPAALSTDLPAGPGPGVDTSRKKLVALDRTDTGVVTGSVEATLNGDDTGVFVEVSDNSRTRATIEATTSKVVLTFDSLTITMQGSTVTVDAGGTTYRLADERLLARLASMFGDIATGMATIPYTLPPTFFEDVGQLAAKADATTVLKAQ